MKFLNKYFKMDRPVYHLLIDGVFEFEYNLILPTEDPLWIMRTMKYFLNLRI